MAGLAVELAAEAGLAGLAELAAKATAMVVQAVHVAALEREVAAVSPAREVVADWAASWLRAVATRVMVRCQRFL